MSKKLFSIIWRNRLRRFRRIYLRHWWNNFEWPLVLGLGIVTLILAFVGFRKHLSPIGDAHTPWDIFYRILQLVFVDSGALEPIEPPIRWELNLARFLVPALAMYTALQALAIIFSEQLKSFRLRFFHNHIVLCGLGRKGLLLANGFLEAGEKVVVIELDESNGRINQCRNQGAIILLGNAADRELLLKARVHKARYLISVCRDDGVNAEIPVLAGDLTKDREDHPLICLTHIRNLHLFHLLRGNDLKMWEGGPLQMQLFNLFNQGAQRLLNTYSMFGPADQGMKEEPRLLLVGLGPLGESLVIQAAEKWKLCYERRKKRLPILMIDEEAGKKKELWNIQYPQVNNFCELIPLPIAIQSEEFQEAKFLDKVTSAYICLEEDSQGLSAALALGRKAKGNNTQVVLCLMEEEGIATLFLRGKRITKGKDPLCRFGLLERTCKTDLLPGGTYEILARLFHEDYITEQVNQGQTPQTNRAMLPWLELSEEFRLSNLLEAEHIDLKLEAIGCFLTPLIRRNAESFRFKKDEIELLARMEHERWLAERLLEGWIFGISRDDGQKLNPNLIPWAKLDETIMEYNKKQIRELPVFLARAGFQIERLT